MKENETICFICGRPDTAPIGGVLLCEEHGAMANAFREDRRSHNRPADIPAWASKQRRKALTVCSIRLLPATAEKADKLAKERGISRNALIEMLINEK